MKYWHRDTRNISSCTYGPIFFSFFRFNYQKSSPESRFTAWYLHPLFDVSNVLSLYSFILLRCCWMVHEWYVCSFVRRILFIIIFEQSYHTISTDKQISRGYIFSLETFLKLHCQFTNIQLQLVKPSDFLLERTIHKKVGLLILWLGLLTIVLKD